MFKNRKYKTLIDILFYGLWIMLFYILSIHFEFGLISGKTWIVILHVVAIIIVLNIREGDDDGS